MKGLNYILKMTFVLLFLAGTALSLSAQSSDAVFEGVSKAILGNDAEALSVYFNETLEVTIPEFDKSAARKQAHFLLKDFFSENPVKGFKIVHKGNSGSTFYATGTYSTEKGEFDTNIFVKKIGDKFLVTQIRFEFD